MFLFYSHITQDNYISPHESSKHRKVTRITQYTGRSVSRQGEPQVEQCVNLIKSLRLHGGHHEHCTVRTRVFFPFTAAVLSICLSQALSPVKNVSVTRLCNSVSRLEDLR